jgi:hypothetical protein
MSDPNSKAKNNAKMPQYNFDLTGPTINTSGLNQQQYTNNFNQQQYGNNMNQ